MLSQVETSGILYRILPGKHPWALAVQRRKLGGGHLRELPGTYQGTLFYAIARSQTNTSWVQLLACICS